MKELSIEQKAKAYDEALKYAKIYYTSGDEDMKMMMKTCFPVLVEESEDERIRKEIKNLLSRIMLGQENFLREDYDWNAWMAWIEKQGEQKDILEDAVLDSNKDGLIADTIRYKREKQGEQKSSWSEEDDLMLKSFVNLVEMYYGGCIDKTEKNKMLDWLKSLRPQSHWKPSEEQIKAFEHFVRSIGESGYVSPYENNTKLLYSLLEQLKKL